MKRFLHDPECSGILIGGVALIMTAAATLGGQWLSLFFGAAITVAAAIVYHRTPSPSGSQSDVADAVQAPPEELAAPVAIVEANIEPPPVEAVAAPFVFAEPVVPALCEPVPVPDGRIVAVATELGASATLTEIVRAQLLGVNQETSNAAFTLVERLKSIDGGVEAILEAIRTSVTVSGTLVSLSKDEAFSKLLQIGSEAARDFAHQAEDVQSGLAESEQLFRFIDEIKDVAEQTNILALNASIEAARAGEAGRAFGVVAREVRNLSNRSSELAKRIAAGTKATLVAIQHRFNGLLERSRENQRQLEAALSEELNHLTDQLSRLMETQDEAIKDVQQRGEDVETLVIGLLANLQFQDVTRQHIDHVVETLRALDAHNEALQRYLLEPDGALPIPQIQPVLDKMYGRYVMEQQRSNHTALTVGVAASSADGAPLIELF